jgi:hypothetical protein
MNAQLPRKSLFVRLAAAVASLGITAVVFSVVVSASEPHRSQLAALTQPPADTPVQMFAEAEAAK